MLRFISLNVLPSPESVSNIFFRLTKKEQKDLEYKKRVLELAKEHRAAGDVEKVDRYYIPRDDIKPQEKYVEDRTEKGQGSEQSRWEEEHLNAALMKFGAKDAKEKKSKKYEVIMDDEIEFVQTLKMPGTMKDKVRKLPWRNLTDSARLKWLFLYKASDSSSCHVFFR